ncbi:MAG: arginine deiminase family protein [Bacteroidales bacterium]|nr:arginine deiminase family protein [Bacteroidales bacterium]
MIDQPIDVCIHSEIGRLNAVLLHRPGSEIEAMTPANAHKALYSDILNGAVADWEYSFFESTLKRLTEVYYVNELLAVILKDAKLKESLVRKSCEMDNCLFIADELLDKDNVALATALIEGFRFRPSRDPKEFARKRYLLQPLYNLFFTRDACSCVNEGVLINSMSFEVRRRESLIYRAIFEHYFGAKSYSAESENKKARTEGGDVQIVRNDLLCVGNGIRTNKEGIEGLLRHYGKGRERYAIIAEELPEAPDSFIHLDMVFTFLGPHACMAFEPMLSKKGIFSGKHTMLHIIEGGEKITHIEYANILEALKSEGIDLQPVLCGGGDDWWAEREQWHSGANFFSFGPNHVLGYRRNRYTIEALAKAGFEVLNAEDVCNAKVDPWNYNKAVVTFAASELPRGGGGARCMTCPINRDEVSY